MRKLLMIAAVAAMTPAYSTDTWVQRDSVGGPEKSACIGFSVGGRGFIGLGFDQLDYKRSVFMYTAQLDDWTKMESLGGITGVGNNRSSAIAFVVGTKAYIGLGQGDNPYLGDLWEYDMSTDVYTQKALFMGSPRREAVAFGIDDYGYVGTGQDASGMTNDFYRYDPATNSWSSIASFPGTPRKQAVGFTMGGKGYVGTGDDGTFTKDFYMYDPNFNTWTQKQDFGGTARYGAIGAASFPSAFIGTGYDNTLSYTKDFWEYNYFSDSWTQRTDFPGTARSNAAAFELNGSIFVGTGYDGGPKDDFYEYAPILGVEQYGLTTSSLFPNPVSDRSILTVKGQHRIDRLEIHDLSGKKVLSKPVSSDQLEIRADDLGKGAYIYTLLNNGELISSGRFVVIG